MGLVFTLALSSAVCLTVGRVWLRECQTLLAQSEEDAVSFLLWSVLFTLWLWILSPSVFLAPVGLLLSGGPPPSVSGAFLHHGGDMGTCTG